MRLIRLVGCVVFAAGCLAADSKSAAKLFQDGQKAERAGDFDLAYLLYTQAAGLDPGIITYWLRSQAVRPHAAVAAGPAALQSGTAPAAPAKPDEAAAEILDTITDEELAEARKPLPPVELKASENRRDLDFQGDARVLFEEVAEAYGLDVVFDGDYDAGRPFRFRLENVDYREALRALEAATNSFIVPLGDRLFLAVKDTPQKRVEAEPTVSVAMAVPAAVSLEEAQEMVRAVQQALAIQRLALDSHRRILLMTDRVSKIRPAQALYEQLIVYRAQVAIEVEFLEASRFGSTSFGLTLQTLFPVVNFSDWLNSVPSIPAGFARFALFGGGRTVLGLGIADAQAFARMTRSEGRTLLRTELRSLDGQQASLHVGDRFPIITGGFIDQIVDGRSNFPPSFVFEDLGLVLRVTPRVHGVDEVSLELDAEFKVLTGESLNRIPVIATRHVQSQVRVRQGERAVIAGLMSASEARTITGPAGLARLPVVGRLLRENTRTTEERQVLLVLKPILLSLPPDQYPAGEVWLGSEGRPRTPL